VADIVGARIARAPDWAVATPLDCSARPLAPAASLALRGVRYAPSSAAAMLRRNLWNSMMLPIAIRAVAVTIA